MQKENKNLFIIMPMSGNKPIYDDVLDSIKEVSKSLNINAFRIDEDISNEKITDRILQSIRDADYTVADLTDSRPNVFFEAGFAFGIDKIPVFIAADGTKLEFDIKDYPIIFFKNQRELRLRLKERLKAIISSPSQLNTSESTDYVINYDEGDIKTLLTGWAQKQVDSKSILESFHFNDIDTELRIPSGSSKKYIKEIVTKKWNIVVDAEGLNTIKFKYGSFPVKSSRVLSRGIDYDKF